MTLYHLPGIVYHSSRFDVINSVVYITIFWCGIQRVKASNFVIVHQSRDKIFQSIGTTM